MRPTRRPLLVTWLIVLLGLVVACPAVGQGGHWRLIDTAVHPAEGRAPPPGHLEWRYAIAPGQAMMEARGGRWEIGYRAEARWDSPPAVLIPGQEVALSLSISIAQWEFDGFELNLGTSLYVHSSGGFREGTQPADFHAASRRWWQNLASAQVYTQTNRPGQRSDRATAVLVAPQPAAGQRLFGVLFGFSGGDAASWSQVVHVYDWQPGPPAPVAPVDDTATDCPSLIASGRVPGEHFRSSYLLAGGAGMDRLRPALTAYQQTLALIAAQLGNRQYDLARRNLARLQEEAQLPVLLAELRAQGHQVSILLRGLPSDAAMAELRQAEQALADNRAAYDLLQDMLQKVNAAEGSANHRFIRQVFVAMVRSFLSWSSLPDMRDMPETLLNWYAEALDEAAALTEGQTDIQRLRTLQRFLEDRRARVVADHHALTAAVRDRAGLAALDDALRAHLGGAAWACWAPAGASDAPPAPLASQPPGPAPALPQIAAPPAVAEPPGTPPPQAAPLPPPPEPAPVSPDDEADVAEPEPRLVVVVAARESLGPDMTLFYLRMRNLSSEPMTVIALTVRAERLPLGGGVIRTGGSGAQLLGPGAEADLTLVATGEIGAVLVEIDLGARGVVRHRLPVDHAAAPDQQDVPPPPAQPEGPAAHLLAPAGMEIGAGDVAALSTPDGRGSPLHAGPGPAYPVLARIAEGDAIEVRHVEGDWARVRHLHGDAEGWVPRAFLDSPPEPGATVLLVIDAPSPGGLPLQASPDSQGAELRRLFGGMVVERIATSGGWIEVLLTDGATGWIPATGARRLP